MNEGTPSGSEHNKPWAAVLKCPNAELYLLPLPSAVSYRISDVSVDYNFIFRAMLPVQAVRGRLNQKSRNLLNASNC
jgi:hypothetical protein